MEEPKEKQLIYLIHNTIIFKHRRNTSLIKQKINKYNNTTFNLKICEDYRNCKNKVDN